MLHSDAIWMSLVIAETWGAHWKSHRRHDIQILRMLRDFQQTKADFEALRAQKNGHHKTPRMTEELKAFVFISSYLVQLNLKPFAHDSLCLHCVSIVSPFHRVALSEPLEPFVIL